MLISVSLDSASSHISHPPPFISASQGEKEECPMQAADQAKNTEYFGLGNSRWGRNHVWLSTPYHTLPSCSLLHFTLCLGKHSSLFQKLFIACVCVSFFYTGTPSTDSWLKCKQDRYCSIPEYAPVFLVFMSSKAHTLFFTSDVTLNSGDQLFHIQRQGFSMVTCPDLHPTNSAIACPYLYSQHILETLTLPWAPGSEDPPSNSGMNKLLLSFPKFPGRMSEEPAFVNSLFTQKAFITMPRYDWYSPGNTVWSLHSSDPNVLPYGSPLEPFGQQAQEPVLAFALSSARLQITHITSDSPWTSVLRQKIRSFQILQHLMLIFTCILREASRHFVQCIPFPCK